MSQLSVSTDRPAASGRLKSDTYKRWSSRGCIYLILSVGAIVMLFPLVWMFLTSVKKQFYMEGENMVWFPPPWEAKYFTTENYAVSYTHLPLPTKRIV